MNAADHSDLWTASMLLATVLLFLLPICLAVLVSMMAKPMPPTPDELEEDRRGIDSVRARLLANDAVRQRIERAEGASTQPPAWPR